jgi:hypothetical protein
MWVFRDFGESTPLALLGCYYRACSSLIEEYLAEQVMTLGRMFSRNTRRCSAGAACKRREFFTKRGAPGFRSKGNPALPYPIRLMSLSLFTFPISDPIAMRQGKTGEDSGFVSFNQEDKALHLADLAGSGLCKPGVEVFSCPGAQSHERTVGPTHRPDSPRRAETEA